VTLRNGAQVGTFTFGDGPGGTVRLTATDTISLVGEATAILSLGFGAGSAAPSCCPHPHSSSTAQPSRHGAWTPDAAAMSSSRLAVWR